MNEQEEFIWGAEEIGKAICRTKRQTYHLLERGLLPAKCVGGRWVASRSNLIKFLTASAST
jgi:hypothetical protein